MTKVLTAPWEPYGPGWPCLKSSSCGRLGLVKTTEVEFRLNVPVLGLWRR